MALPIQGVKQAVVESEFPKPGILILFTGLRIEELTKLIPVIEVGVSFHCS